MLVVTDAHGPGCLHFAICYLASDGLPVKQLDSLMVGWLVGWVFGWMVEWLVRQLVGGLDG